MPNTSFTNSINLSTASVTSSPINWANLTLSSPNTGFTAQTLDDFTVNFNPYVKKYEMYEIDEDLLALSVTWKRLRDAKKSVASKLLDPSLFKELSADDKTKADQIRDYYSKKIMMWKLKGTGKLTSYREDLNSFIHSDGKKFRDNMFGLVYRLPDFYNYDLEMDDIYMHLEKDHPDLRKKLGVETAIKLQPLRKVVRKTKSVHAVEYWFKSRNDIGVTLKIDPKNPLLHIWDHMFGSQKELVIETKLFPKERDGLHYLQASDWKLNME